MAEQIRTIEDVRRLLRELDPITRKNILATTERLSTNETYNHIVFYKKRKGLDTEEGMQKYKEVRKNGCKGCKK